MPLDAVDNVLVAVAACGGLQRGHVGAGELLGDGIRLMLLAAHRRQQPPLALIIGRHLHPPLRWGGHHPAQPIGHPPALLLHQHLLQRRAAGAADRGRHIGGVQAQFDCAALMLGRQFLWQDAARELGLHLMGHQRLDERTRRVAGCADPRSVRPYIRHLPS